VSKKAVFSGLVYDEYDQQVVDVLVGDEPCYVVDDAGFHRHIPSELVDQQVLESMKSLIEGHEGMISEQAAKMLGQDDIFSIALIEKQLEEMDQHFDQLRMTGIPEDARAYMGMIGFKIIINVHGDVIRIDQPATGISEDY
jgi:hypothetical protein